MVLSTNVQDTDGDGLLDVWENGPAVMDVSDPTDRLLPNLGAMGAHPEVKDVFVEVGYLHADQPTVYGGVVKPAHTHLPSEEALNLVGKAFADAPVTNPNGSTGIRIHFDVGDRYPTSPYVIKAPFTRGGEDDRRDRVRCRGSAVSVSEPSRARSAGRPASDYLRDQILRADVPQIPGRG